MNKTTKIRKITHQTTSMSSLGSTETSASDMDFNIYDEIYNGSYIVSGIVDRIGRTINSGYKTDNTKLKGYLEKIDIVFVGKSLAKYGNCFLEITRKGNGDIDTIYPIITSTIKKFKGGGYVQEIGTKKVYFNEFTPLDKRTGQKLIYEKSGADKNTLKYNEKEKSTGFNPNLNEVIHIKISETDNKQYGNSMFMSVMQQILILKSIDNQILKYFENGRIQQYLLLDPEDKLSNEDLEQLSGYLSSKKGNADAFSTFVIPTNLVKLNISDEIDIEQLISLRKEMQKSIAMRMNMPYDLLSSDNSNKASSSTAIESFNRMTVIPLQKTILNALKEIFYEQFKVDIESLEFMSLDSKNKKEEAERLKALVQSGIITTNEARNELGFADVEGGDTLQSNNGINFQLHPEEIQKVQKLTHLIKKEVNEIHNK